MSTRESDAALVANAMVDRACEAFDPIGLFRPKAELAVRMKEALVAARTKPAAPIHTEKGGTDGAIVTDEMVEDASLAYDKERCRLNEQWHGGKCHPMSDVARNNIKPMFKAALIAGLACRETTKGETDAARDVLDERKRQVEKEGWSHAHDDNYTKKQLIRAAICYATAPGQYLGVEREWVLPEVPARWPWCATWWKPRYLRDNLVKAGALILAEIERLDRAALARRAQPAADQDAGRAK